MAETSKPAEAEAATPQAPTVSVVGQDRVRVEFRIEDLLEQLMRGMPGRGSVAACNGCNKCSASLL